MIKNIDELAKFVKGGADVLQKAIESEDEMSLELIEGSFVSDSELEDLKNERFNSGKKEGQTIGYDFAMKDVKKDFGIDIEGKNREEILKAAKNKIMADAKVEPDKKVQELNQSLENLRQTYNSEKQNWEKQENNFKNQLKDIRVMSEIEKNAPELKGLKSSHFATLAKMEYDFDFDENGSLLVKKGGETIKDKMEKPIPAKNILTDFATQNGWYGEPGRNGSDSGGKNKKFESQYDVFKYMEENGIQPNTAEGEKLLNDFENSKND
jgi:hypothetical protein